MGRGPKLSHPPGGKICSKCRVTKPLDDFYANSSNSDGRSTFCKICQKTAVIARKDADREGHRERQKDEIARYHKKYPQKHKTPENIRQIRHRARDKIKAYVEAHTQTNGEET